MISHGTIFRMVKTIDTIGKPLKKVSASIGIGMVSNLIWNGVTTFFKGRLLSPTGVLAMDRPGAIYFSESCWLRSLCEYPCYY